MEKTKEQKREERAMHRVLGSIEFEQGGMLWGGEMFELGQKFPIGNFSSY